MECTNKCLCRRCNRWRTIEDVYLPMLGYFALCGVAAYVIAAIIP
jgi:hypothetical protein